MKYIPNKKITIGPSAIEGLGVFAAQDIKEGEDLGYTHVDSPLDGLFPQNMIRIEWGSRINHCGNKANIIIKRADEVTIRIEETGNITKKIKYYKAYALRDIKEGEELCNDYGADGEDNCPCGQDYVNDL